MISITPNLKFTHYGNPSITINNQFGYLDTRTGVGHITRNIKFVSGPDYGWGYRVIGYSYADGLIMRTGNLNLNSV
jgi:hypothetical protein